MVHYRVHSSPQLVHILSQINPVHVLPSNFFKIYFNIILPSTPTSPKWFLFSGFPPPKPRMSLSSLPYMPHTPSISILDLIKRIILGEEYKPSGFSLCSFLQPTVTSSLLSINIFLSTIFSNTLWFCSFMNVRDNSHTHKKKQAKL